jgi:probable rRNA maturation factor
MKEPGPGSASGRGQGGEQGVRGVWDLVLQNPNRYPEAGTRRLRPWLERLLCSLVPAAAGAERSLGVRFAGDREMRRVNRDFRGKDKTTDVLSFPGEEEHVGDILISVPTARRQAAEAGHPVEREIKILLLHGLLHCMGYDHETDDGAMERLERKLRRAWIPAKEGAGDA